MSTKRSQNLQGSTCCICAVCNFIKKDPTVLVFSYEFKKNFKNTYFEEQIRATGSEDWIIELFSNQFVLDLM